MCQGDVCIATFWMSLCLIMIINIFSPLNSIQDDYWACHVQQGDIKISIILDDRVSSCHLRDNTYYRPRIIYGVCHVATQMTNCSWYKDIEHFRRLSPNVKTEAFADEYLANTYLTSMEEKESEYWPHHGICLCNLRV